MANFSDPSNPTFVGVRQIETNDPVLGGAAEIGGSVNSPANHAFRSLVERTAYLKEEIEGIVIPNATTSVRGIAQLATVSEVTSGQNSAKIVTPYALQQKIDDIPDGSVPNATASQRGVVELANNSEVDTGTDGTRAVTPAGLQRKVSAINIPSAPGNASQTARGIVELANNSEVDTGTDDTRAVTPAGLQRKLSSGFLNHYTGHKEPMHSDLNTSVPSGSAKTLAAVPQNETFVCGGVGLQSSLSNVDVFYAPLTVSGSNIQYTVFESISLTNVLTSSRLVWWYLTI